MVREIDERYVPIGSAQSESVYIGELPAGTHRIAFRLDGYGTSDSGVELTGVELGQKTVTTTATTADAKIFLDSNTIFALAASNATVDVYGNTGQETLTVPTGASSISVDQNIERVDLAGLPSDYTYQQTGNILNVYSGGTLVFKAPVQSDADGTVIGFDTGVASAQLTGGVMTLGAATVPSSAPGVVNPSLR